MKYNVEMESTYTVEFPDPKKVEDFYVNGEWSDCFWDLDDLDDLIRSVMYSFVRTDTSMELRKGTYVKYKDIEGFPEFIRDKDNFNKWISSHDECGTIIVIEDAELEVSWVTED